MERHESSLTVIIPAYNEEKSLAAFLPEVLLYCKENSYNLIVVDDGSVDGTGILLEEYVQKFDLKIITHKLNKGYGGAIKSGIEAATTKFIITIDADGQHVLSDIRKLHEEVLGKDADMIIGSRKGQKTTNIYRKIGKSIIRFIAKFLVPIEIYDINSGMKIYNTELARKYYRLCPDTMSYSDIIALIFISQRHLVLESPIQIKPRKEGSSTVNTMTALETLKEILNIVLLFNPMKIFFPIALLSILAGLGWGIPFMVMGRGVSGGALLALISGLIFFFLGLIAEQLSLLRKADQIH